jgi:cytochrome c-type biogenesis protein CcmF
MAIVGSVLGAWIIASSLIVPISRWRRGLGVPAAVLGMAIAHIGAGAFVLGVTTVQSNSVERDVALVPGQSAMAGEYQFRFDNIETVEGPNYDGFRGHVTVLRKGVVVTTLAPEKRHYWVQGTVMAKAAIAAGWNRDLLAALGEDVGNNAWSLRLQYRPLIRFVWIGALIMAIGGLTTLWDRRYRVAELVVAPLADGEQAGQA